MPRIKICGITSIEDGLAATRLGADALGFVFYPESPRFVKPDQVRAIVAALPPFISTVGLFVNEEAARVVEIMTRCGLDIAQLHGDIAVDELPFEERRIIRALRVRDEASLEDVGRIKDATILLDTYVKGRMGGTGETFDWSLAARVAKTRRVVLAGGLTPENVAEAIRTVRPYGVDVSSGVEMSPGRKDSEKIAAFIRNARNV
ncbi:MAG: phosphoribosylanthranilate isomerase [Deltaproteobacteria bacterium]|nr:phosphoribosylanthranilate isomerase [Deltaproteobacteria bacterium]